MLRRLGLLGTALAVLAVSAPAAGGDWSLHVVGSAELGWTDNVFSAPDDPEPGAPEKEADFYTQLTPGGLFTFETPRMIQELLYELDANLYLENSEARGLNHRVGWRSHWLTSPLTDLSVSASASAGTTSTFNTATTAATGELMILPSGRSDYRGLEVRENFNWQRSRETRLSQSMLARAFTTEDHTNDNRTTGIEAGLGAGVDRAWRSDALGLHVDPMFVRLSQASAAMTTQTSDQVIAPTTLMWRRDLSRHWTSIVDVGATTIVPLIKPSATVVQPTVGAMVSYSPDWGSAGIQVRRSVAPNLYIAQNTITDAASVSCWLPLPWLAKDPREPTLSFQTTLGGARTSILDAETSEVASRFYIGTADVAIGYQIAPQVTVGARYQFLIQDSDEDAMLRVFGYHRHTVLISFSGRWPSRVAGEIPAQESLRVDRDQPGTPAPDDDAAPRR